MRFAFKFRVLLPFLLILSTISLSFSTHSVNSVQPDISGEWLAQGEMGEGLVEIFQDANNKWQGRLIRAANPEHQQKVSKAKAEKGVSEVLVLRNFEYVGDNTWKNGKLFLMNREMEVSGKIQLLPSGELKVTGWFAFLKKSKIWRRNN